MGRQRNNPQMKVKEEASERMLNEIEASQLSDIELKAKVIRKLCELTENYQKLQENYNELTANYINMKKEIETINKGQEEMKNTISFFKKRFYLFLERRGERNRGRETSMCNSLSRNPY